VRANHSAHLGIESLPAQPRSYALLALPYHMKRALSQFQRNRIRHTWKGSGTILLMSGFAKVNRDYSRRFALPLPCPAARNLTTLQT
jgi:hypothetical protein